MALNETPLSRAATPSAGLDVARIRKDFPILDRVVRGQRLVYLDSANTSQKPRAVLDAMERYYEQSNANVHRGTYLIAEEATAALEGARAKVAGFVGAGSPREIVFTKNATEALNLVAKAWGRANLRAGEAALSKTIAARTSELRAALKEYQRIQPFLDRLQKDPNDPQANLEVGASWCFVRDRWEKGLPYLAKSQHPVLQGLARKELENPAQGERQANWGGAPDHYPILWSLPIPEQWDAQLVGSSRGACAGSHQEVALVGVGNDTKGSASSRADHHDLVDSGVGRQ